MISGEQVNALHVVIAVALDVALGGAARAVVALTSGSAAAILREKLARAMISHAEGFSIGSGLLPRDVTAPLCATILVEVLGWWLRQDEHPSAAFLAEAIERTVVQPALRSW